MSNITVWPGNVAAQCCEMLHERSRLGRNVSDRGEKTVVRAGDVSHKHKSEIKFHGTSDMNTNSKILCFL